MATTETRQDVAVRSSAITLLTVGGVCGLAWAAGFRGFMAGLAGDESTVHWYGTFVQILLPGVLIGMLFGWAEHLRRTGGQPRRWWLVCTPLVFALFVLVSPESIAGLLRGEVPFADGLGLGAVLIPLMGMAGGYALSGRGPLWGRLAAGLFALLPIPGWAIAASFMGADVALTNPGGAWIAATFYSFYAVLVLACIIPHRPEPAV